MRSGRWIMVGASFIVAGPVSAERGIESVDHVLKAVASDDRAANLATYGDPDLPLADGVAGPIAGFVKEHARR